MNCSTILPVLLLLLLLTATPVYRALAVTRSGRSRGSSSSRPSSAHHRPWATWLRPFQWLLLLLLLLVVRLLLAWRVLPRLLSCCCRPMHVVRLRLRCSIPQVFKMQLQRLLLLLLRLRWLLLE